MPYVILSITRTKSDWLGSNLEPQPFLSGQFRNRGVRSQATVEDSYMARGLDGVGERSNDILVMKLQIYGICTRSGSVGLV